MTARPVEGRSLLGVEFIEQLGPEPLVCCHPSGLDPATGASHAAEPAAFAATSG